MHILNLFGDGVRYWTCDPSEPKWEQLIEFRMKHQLRWDQVLFDLSTLKKFGFDHWGNLAVGEEKFGLILSAKNRLEIKKGAKILLKFRANELNNETLLFPRFQTQIRESEGEIDHPLVLLQFETGLIAKYSIETDSLKLDDLTFLLEQPIRTEQDMLFTQLLFRGKDVLRSEDTVVRGLRVVE